MTRKKTETQGDDTTVKKRRIGTLLLLAAGILGVGGAGFLFGQGAREPDIVVVAQQDQSDEEESSRIAVVNLDEGVQGSGGRTNYAQSLSRIMSMLLWRRPEVVLTQAHMAHTSSYRQPFHRALRASTQRHSRLIWSMR